MLRLMIKQKKFSLQNEIQILFTGLTFGADPANVPIEAEIGTGVNWLEAH